MREKIVNSKMISLMILLALVGCGKSDVENLSHIYRPCSISKGDKIQSLLVGTWRIDDSSLDFLRSRFGWKRFLDKNDHWFVVESNGVVFVHMCLSPYYGQDGDAAYGHEIEVLAQDNCYDPGRDAYRMSWRITSPDDIMLRSKGMHGDPYNDFFSNYYINVDYPNRFRTGLFFEKSEFQVWPFTFVAIGSDSAGLYLTPRFFHSVNSYESGSTMDVALKFRK